MVTSSDLETTFTIIIIIIITIIIIAIIISLIFHLWKFYI